MDQERPDPGDGQEPTLVVLARFSGHGLTLAMATGFFLFLGWTLDQRLGSVPVFTIIGALVGAAAGFYHIVRELILLPQSREKDRREKDRKGGDAE